MLILLLAGQLHAQTWKPTADIARIERMLVRNHADKGVNVKLLAPAIYRLSRQYNVSQSLVTKIIIQESRGRADAYNHASKDCGVAQLNAKTIRLYKLDVQHMCNPANWRLNLAVGVKILAKAKRPCEFNQGPKIRNQPLCLKYERSLAAI